MKKSFYPILFLFCCLYVAAEWAYAQRTVSGLVSKGGAGTTRKSTAQWDRINVKGVEHIKISEMMEFYDLLRSSKQPKPGYTTYVSKDRYVSYRTGRQDFYVNNFRYVLSHPIVAHGGDALISVVDVVKLVDPVMRPNYSLTSSKVTTIVLDPGHGGHDSGAVSKYAVEKTCNLQLARKIRDRLVKKGYRVVMTRDSDVFLTLQQRVNIANQQPNSIFVSIHHNSGRSAASGIETFTLAPVGTTSPFARSRVTRELQGNSQDSENVALATAIHSRCIKATGAIDRGIQRARFSVLCTIRRPAVLFEGGFVSNAKEGRAIMTDSYQNKLADAIYVGIVNYAQIVASKSNSLRSTRR